MIVEAIKRVVEGGDLREEEASAAMEEIMRGEATPAQIAALITALRMKGETVEEITGCARAMRLHATSISTFAPATIDTCGTGGDGGKTFNISTTAAFVVAGAGVAVAKHGNRSVSSRCGSADLLKALGIEIEVEKERVEECLREVGIGFLFAPLLHRAMKYALGPRREIGIRTLFNILGPLTNPAQVRAQVLGVFRADLTERLASVLGKLGSHHALVVHGLDGMDEITTSAPTQISEWKEERVRTIVLEPESVGIQRAALRDLAGGEPEENAEITVRILKGERGPRRDIVLLNAAAGLLVGGKAKDLTEGMGMAAHSIDSGLAWAKLEALRDVSRGK
ncbi:MAG: anthranilate phosphoribosyltransferase [candidate division NC10 bacterium]|nr:anthranilate phosphoribosyltransferase [candidate division NC10 bacterium]